MTKKKQKTRLQSQAKLATVEKWSRACLPFCHEMGESGHDEEETKHRKRS